MGLLSCIAPGAVGDLCLSGASLCSMLASSLESHTDVTHWRTTIGARSSPVGQWKRDGIAEDLCWRVTRDPHSAYMHGTKRNLRTCTSADLLFFEHQVADARCAAPGLSAACWYAFISLLVETNCSQNLVL